MKRMPSPTHRTTVPSARWFTKLWATDEGSLVFVSKVVSFMRLWCHREMTRVYSREWVQATERCAPEIAPKRESSENNRKKNLPLCSWMIAIITQYNGGAPSAMARAKRNGASSAWFSRTVATVSVSFAYASALQARALLRERRNAHSQAFVLNESTQVLLRVRRSDGQKSMAYGRCRDYGKRGKRVLREWRLG